jgi:hypothetical protein
MLRRPWKGLFQECERVGYAEGLGNIARYMERLGVSNYGHLMGVHEFLGHRLGIAIALRDAAQRSFAAGDMRGAIAEFRTGWDIARAQSDPTLALTFVRLGSEIGTPVMIDPGQLAEMQAPWASQYRFRRR